MTVKRSMLPIKTKLRAKFFVKLGHIAIVGACGINKNRPKLRAFTLTFVGEDDP